MPEIVGLKSLCGFEKSSYGNAGGFEIFRGRPKHISNAGAIFGVLDFFDDGGQGGEVSFREVFGVE